MALIDMIGQTVASLIELACKLVGYKFGKSKIDARKIENRVFWLIAFIFTAFIFFLALKFS